MKAKKKKYAKPKMTKRRIKLSFFLRSIRMLDDFNLIQQVYGDSCSGCNA